MKLSTTRFQLARDFIHRHARELDIALFEFTFGSGTSDAVIEKLSCYQNDDGGFGHSIEPDFRLEASSPMATSVGLQYCVAVHAGDHPVVTRAIEYLVDTYNRESGYWPATGIEVNEGPHAPWWHVDEVKPPDEDGWPNPSAELFGYLYRYTWLVPHDLLDAVTSRARQNLNHSPTIEGFYRYNLLCWERAMPYLPFDLRNIIHDRILATYHKYPVTKENYGEVSITMLAPSPDSMLAVINPQLVAQLLDEEPECQAKDGGWWPTWQWGQYEDTWQLARREWAGKLTVDALRALYHHGRIEGF